MCVQIAYQLRWNILCSTEHTCTRAERESACTLLGTVCTHQGTKHTRTCTLHVTGCARISIRAQSTHACCILLGAHAPVSGQRGHIHFAFLLGVHALVYRPHMHFVCHWVCMYQGRERTCALHAIECTCSRAQSTCSLRATESTHTMAQSAHARCLPLSEHLHATGCLSNFYWYACTVLQKRYKNSKRCFVLWPCIL